MLSGSKTVPAVGGTETGGGSAPSVDEMGAGNGESEAGGGEGGMGPPFGGAASTDAQQQRNTTTQWNKRSATAFTRNGIGLEKDWAAAVYQPCFCSPMPSSVAAGLKPSARFDG